MFSTFSVSQTGLQASRFGIDNVSNNQANKNTPGYKKRVADLSEIGQYFTQITGRGVSKDSISRVTAQYMYDKYMQETTKATYYDKLSNMLGAVEAVFKETDSSGFSYEIDKYFQSVEHLRTNPHSEVYRSFMKTQGAVVVNTLKNMYESIQKQQQVEAVELKTDVNEVNSILKEIADINFKMEKYGTSTNDLLDKRDLLELKLAKYVDTEINRDVGFYEIKIGGVVAVSNDIFDQEIKIDLKEQVQVDKYNHIETKNDGSFFVYDSLKYNEDFTEKAPYKHDDVITYRFNNEYSISLQIDQNVTGNWDNDPDTPDTTQRVTNENLTRAFVVKINSDETLSKHITAYNGEYAVMPDGKKEIMYPNVDHYLRIESNIPGKNNDFLGRFSVERKNGAAIKGRETIYRNEIESKNAQTDTVLRILEHNLELKSGSIKAQVENLSTSNPNNKFQSYLNMLDNFAQTLADVTTSYIRTGAKDYVFGKNGSDAKNTAPFPPNGGDIVELKIFSGASVKTLEFHKNMVNDLKQENLEYLAQVQWKNNFSFEGKAQNENSKSATSMVEYFRDTKVSVSRDKEEANYSFEVQDTIATNLGTAYNDVVKVDSDSEMIDLMKFQAAFSANAKVISAVDEMIQVLLGMKR